MWCEFQGTLAVALSSIHGPPRCGRWWMVSFTMHTSVSSLQRVPLHRRALQTSMGGAQAILSPDDAAAILDCART
jgi:hypothetical protein